MPRSRVRGQGILRPEAGIPSPGERVRLHRLSHRVDDAWVAHAHPAVFLRDEQRIVATAPDGGPAVFARLVSALAPPCHLLYVLHTSRGEAEVGRYQSPALPWEQIQAFLAEFAPFLSGDGRFDLWAYSPAERASVVWDRHNQVFAYGPLERFSSELLAMGFQPGRPEVPSPHAHHYRAELDDLAARLLVAFEWHYSPLRPEDTQ